MIGVLIATTPFEVGEGTTYIHVVESKHCSCGCTSLHSV